MLLKKNRRCAVKERKFGLKNKAKDNGPELSKLEAQMLKILPKEADEDSNPKVKLYNEMVRHAMVYDTEMFSRCGVTDDAELDRIFRYVLGDYPEIFWIEGYRYNQDGIQLAYRCLDENGKLDVKQIDRKREALRKGAKQFTKGITKKTKPYDALITIYRRLVLALDYDGRGLQAKVDEDITKDDRLRSLYSAIVEHKVVCAGYAAAMQYLLQSVGISCGYVSSNRTGGSGHAFNALKIGKYCYYLDATWGDRSNTSTGDFGKNDIRYDYCCVPLREFVLTEKSQEVFHTPNSELYPDLEEFRDTNHEYFRFRKAYLVRYDEDAIVNVFASSAETYDEKEMGSFTVGFRCHDGALARYVSSQLLNGANLKRILDKASKKVKKKSQARNLRRECLGVETTKAGTVYVCFK